MVGKCVALGIEFTVATLEELRQVPEEFIPAG
jgi:hypothetical protein